MKIEQLYDPTTDRYAFDFRYCHYQKGWAQFDTSQDTSYYGNWINPLTRQLVNFAEGDITIVTCENDDEFIAQVSEKHAWHLQQGYVSAIDGMCSETIIARFQELGLTSLLH